MLLSTVLLSVIYTCIIDFYTKIILHFPFCMYMHTCIKQTCNAEPCVPDHQRYNKFTQIVKNVQNDTLSLARTYLISLMAMLTPNMLSCDIAPF